MITPEMSVMDVMIELAQGNPGAISVLSQVVERSNHVDPDNKLGFYMTMFMLDDLGINGSSLWMLYKDVCGGTLEKFLACIRAFQLGIIQRDSLKDAICNPSLLDTNDIFAKVQDQLPSFARYM